MGAVAELMRTDEATFSDEVASATATGPDKAGVTTETGLGIGAVSLGQVFDSPSDSALAARVRDVAQKFGLKVGALKILHPLSAAIDVTFVVPDDTPITWTIDQLRAALVGSSPDVEGALIELDSPSGAPLLRSGVAYRNGEGGLWFAHQQDSRFGAGHGTFYRASPEDD
ncbi:MAG: hypothetical protein JWP74_2557 [Marmoricola sp.]|nr:hypothetical protein [Marmoricola sp.]